MNQINVRGYRRGIQKNDNSEKGQFPRIAT